MTRREAMKRRGYVERVNEGVSELMRRAVIVRGEVYSTAIGHDDWCVVYNGEPRCNCYPTIEIVAGGKVWRVGFDGKPKATGSSH